VAARTEHPPAADRSPRYPGGPVRCGVRGCGCEDPRQLRNAANAGHECAAAAHSWPLLLAAYLTYWIGDSADGNIARFQHQETRFGAYFDVICDRVNCVSCALVFLQFVDAPWPIAVFLFQFVVVDLPLTLLPMRWPVLSPNYFFLIDRLAYTLNWHVVAKVTNTTLLITLLVLLPHQQWIALVAASTVLLIKVWSLGRVLRLTVPKDTPHVPQGMPAGV
jgi:phosphatidylglycerophosphate synthase